MQNPILPFFCVEKPPGNEGGESMKKLGGTASELVFPQEEKKRPKVVRGQREPNRLRTGGPLQPGDPQD